MVQYSFVIPAYNQKKLLGHTLEALNNLKDPAGKGYEVVLVDDGSQDGTRDYIKGINKNYGLKYIYLERDSRACRARARNRGWQAADGNIVLFIDADILVKDNYISELDRCYQLDDRLVITGTRLMLPRGATINPGNPFEFYKFNSRSTSFLEVRHFIFDRLSYNMSAIRYPGLLLLSCNAAIPKKYLQALGGFDENFKGWGLEDNDLGCRLALLKEPKLVVNSRLEVLHQYHACGENAVKEYMGNLEYFSKKEWSGSCNLSIHEAIKINDVLSLPEDSYIHKFSSNRGNIPKKAILDLRDAEKLDEVKETVTHLLSDGGTEIVINDYIENTGLDIWVQLLECKYAPPRYFPASRRLKRFEPHEIRQYILKHML